MRLVKYFNLSTLNSLYIVMPLYNEESNIESLVNRNVIIVKKMKNVFKRKDIANRFIIETSDIYKEIAHYMVESSEKPKRRYSI